MHRLTVAASVVNVGLLVGLLLMPALSSAEWWAYTVFCYAPKLPLLGPAALLGMYCVIARRWFGVAINLIGLGLVAGPIMGLSLGGCFTGQSRQPSIRVLTSNIQNGEARLYSLMLEIRRARPDIILLQEVSPKSLPIIEQELKDWRGVSSGEFWVGAREQPKLVGECETGPYQRKTAVACDVVTTLGPVNVIAVHLTTVRWGLAKLLGDPGDSHSRIEIFQQHEAGRLEEARQTRRWVDEVAGARALLGGDFNATPQCKLYDSNWRDFHNTFEEAGIGYGYTARCDDPAYWPANTPWVRIDHIVHGSEWRCVRTGRGQTAGSDHRFIWADVVRVSSE